MNKARRNELAKLKQKKRKRNYGIQDESGHHYLKSTGKPCSCIFCQPKGKFRDKRNGKKDKKIDKIIF